METCELSGVTESLLMMIDVTRSQVLTVQMFHVIVGLLPYKHPNKKNYMTIFCTTFL